MSVDPKTRDESSPGTLEFDHSGEAEALVRREQYVPTFLVRFAISKPCSSLRWDENASTTSVDLVHVQRGEP